MIRSSATLVAALVLVWSSGCHRQSDAGPDLPDKVEFNRHVRVILADKCFPCHGPDGRKREADLRLDVRESALAEHKGGHPIVPGDTRQSELVRRISSTDPGYRMPPPASNRTLTPHDIGVLTKWIEQGAEYQPHWSYLPVRRPALPAVKDPAWNENPIDRFIMAGLDAHGIHPSPAGDPVTLARRVSFDLTGLPPTPEEAETFARTNTVAAYRHFVDHKLASPHYGERMAEYWLDLVRFADTNGYNEDQHHNIYPYRDYVIAAFNDNMPFDQFTVEQLAGDLLPSPTTQQRVASGYNRLNKVSTEAGSQEKEFMVKYAADRVRTTATVWLGATLGCAECHDHKFDPYTAKDFYSFAAFFADIQEDAVPQLGSIAMPPEVAIWSPQVKPKLDALNSKIAAARSERSAAIDADRAGFDAELTNWGRGTPQPSTDVVSAYPPFRLAEWSSMDGAMLDHEGQLRLKSPNFFGRRTMARTVKFGEGNLEFLLDVSAVQFLESAGKVVSGFSWALSQSPPNTLIVTIVRPLMKEVEVNTGVGKDTRGVEIGPPQNVKSVRLRALWNASKKEWHVSYGLNGAPPTTAIPGGAVRVDLADASAEWTESFSMMSAPFDQDAISSALDVQAPSYLELVIARDVVRRHEPMNDPPAEVAAIREIAPAQRSDTQRRTLDDYYVSTAPRFATWNAQIDDLEAQKRLEEAPLPHSLTTVSTAPHVTRIRNHGDWQDETGEIVGPAVPASLPPLPTGMEPNRLALARWLVSPDNPLTARVLVNRLWALFFGHGIVRTLDDLGSQGAEPSHPELLDWLAAELIETHWDIKHVIRLIVTSRTYQQSSAERADLQEIDPENTLLARQSSFRLDAEMIRDNALVVSGLLSPTIGGPSVKPYQPEQYWDDVSQVLPGSPAARWKASPGTDQYRRGLYTYWKRTFLHPSLMAFDAPTREECVAQRTRSSTPLQALVLLNDPTYVEAARVLAEHAADSGGTSPEDQIRWAYRQALSRPPSAAVLDLLTQHYDQQLHTYAAAPESARLIAAVGNTHPASEWSDASHMAALTSVCRVLLNLNETITRN